MESKYLILCLNTAHPSKQDAFFLLTDGDDNTAIFESESAAREWIKENLFGSIAYSLIEIDTLSYVM